MWPPTGVAEAADSAIPLAVPPTSFESTPVVVLVGAVALLAIVVGGTALRRRGSPGALSLAALAFGAGWWSLTYALELGSPTLEATLWFGRLSYVGITVVPVAWFTFALAYTGRGAALTRARLVVLAAPAAAMVVLAWTTLSTGLVWQEYELVSTAAVSVPVLAVTYGPAFWLWTAYAYLLIGGGTLLLVLSVERARLFQRQTATLLVAVSGPWLGNVAFLSGLSPLDLTPVGFVVSAAVVVGGFSRFALLDLSPVTGGIARAELVERLPEAVVAVDDSGRIVDLNPSAEAVFGTTLDDAVGSQLSRVAPTLASFLDDRGAEADGTGPDFVVSDPPRQYEVRVSSLRDDPTMGELLTLSDVTERRQREREIAVLNRVLRHDLRNDVAVVENYATLLERDPGNAEYIAVLKNRAGEMYDLVETVRQVERHLDADEPTLATLNVAQLVSDRAAAAAEAYPDATVETDLPAEAWVRAVDLVGSALDNLLENAVEHNPAPEPSVRISVERVTVAGDPYVEITIADDGPSIGEDDLAVLLGTESSLDAASGLGLWLVNWIVTDSGGELTYEPNEPQGNVVTVRLRAPDDDRYDGPDPRAAEEYAPTSRRNRGQVGVGRRPSTDGAYPTWA